MKTATQGTFRTTCHSGNYQPCQMRNISYIVLHYTAGHGDTAQNNVDYFRNNTPKASAHYFVDANGWKQSVADNDIAWAVGTAGVYTQKHKYCRNSNSVSIEMCCETDGQTISKATTAQAVKLTRLLMEKYQIPASDVLRHWDVVNKACPATWTVDETLWKDFKEALEMTGEEIYGKLYEYLQSKPCPEWAKKELQEAVDMGITDGSNPCGFIPRYQAAIMAKRAVETALKTRG